MTGSSPSLDNAQYANPKLPRSTVDWLISTYLAANDADPMEPLHSPVFRDLTGLPPTLIQVGGKDPLHDDGIRLGERARECGVEVTITEYPESGHTWVVKGTNPRDPSAEAALQESASFLAAVATAS